MENKFQTKLEHMMQKVMNDFKDSMTKVMNSMTAQLERIQTSNLHQFSQTMQPTLTTNHLLTDKKEQDSTSSYMVNIAQGRAHHNSFHHVNSTIPLPSQDDTNMKS